MYASIFGNLTVIIQRLYLQSSRQKEDLLLIREFVNFYKIPWALKENLENHILHESHFLKAGDLQAVSRFSNLLFQCSLSCGKKDTQKNATCFSASWKDFLRVFSPTFSTCLATNQIVTRCMTTGYNYAGVTPYTGVASLDAKKVFLGPVNFFSYFPRKLFAAATT